LNYKTGAQFKKEFTALPHPEMWWMRNFNAHPSTEHAKLE
jgi:hypothetical protein